MHTAKRSCAEDTLLERDDRTRYIAYERLEEEVQKCLVTKPTKVVNLLESHSVLDTKQREKRKEFNQTNIGRGVT